MGTKEREVAYSYVGDYWPDHVSDLGLRAALGEPVGSFDGEIEGSEDLPDYRAILGVSLKEALGIPDEMFEAMIVADENIRRKVEAQYDDSIAPGANGRYDTQWSKVEPPAAVHDRMPFSDLASCQGGEEVAFLFAHPTVGAGQVRMSAQEYRLRTSPYVAAFGRELYPGDAEAGLVLDDVRHHLA